MSVFEPRTRPRPAATGAPFEERLDALGARLQELARDALPTGGPREALQGRWLGHALHPALTDLPIGFFTSAAALDLLAGRHARRASQRLVGLGLLSTLPTIATGWAEFADAPREARRPGVLHVAANVTGTVAYLASWRARRRGHHLRGMAFGALGGAALTVGGALGGQLAFELGVGVGHRDAAGTSVDPVTPSAAETDLERALVELPS
jgi:uncharacterized membrane protein